MNKVIVTKRCVLAALCLLTMLGCRGVDSDNGIGDDRGEVSVWIADGAVDDLRRVEVVITGVEITPVGGPAIEILRDQPLVVDLLNLGDDDDPRERIIRDHKLPVGEYESIRLLLDQDSLIVELKSTGQQPALTIAEDAQDKLELPLNVNIEDDTDLDLTMDLDLRKSLRRSGEGEFELDPSLRIVRTSETGNITGTVDAALIENDSKCRNGALNDKGNAVYVFSGSGSAIQDIRGDSGDPLVTAVVDDDFNQEYQFFVGFLPRGSYTVVFTCDASVDDLTVNNEVGVRFSDPINVAVEAGSTESITFSESGEVN